MIKPFISICIPLYLPKIQDDKGILYLKECLDSCVLQTYKDYEIIICDDGSSEPVIDIINEYCIQHKQIKFFRNKKNLGLLGNWSMCVDKANGTWIKFLFQDDFMTAHCLDEFSKNITDKVDLIVCKRNFLLEEHASKELEMYYQNEVRTLENTGYFNSNEFNAQTVSIIANENISLNFIAEPSLALFKKDSLIKVGGFDDELKQICDLEFLLRLASYKGLRYIPQKLCAFRIHNSSTTVKNVNSNDYYFNNIEALLYALKLLTKPEFKNFRSSIGTNGIAKHRMFVKYRAYKAFKAIKNSDDQQVFDRIRFKYRHFMYKWYDIPLLKLYASLK